jgi:hypothetical protein
MEFLFKFNVRAYFLATQAIQLKVRARPTCTLALAGVAWTMQSIAANSFST